MDDDPELQQDYNKKSLLEHISTTTDYISIPLTLLAIITDLSLVYVVWKQPQLQHRTNYFIMHFAFNHMLYILSTPCFYIVLDLFFGGWLDVQWHCVWIRVENLGIALCLTFIFLYGFNQFKPNAYKKWFWWLIYTVNFIIYLVSAIICLKQAFANHLNFHFLTFYYLTLLTTSLTFYIKYNSHNFSLPILVLLVWLPLFLWYNLINIFSNNKNVEILLWHTAFLSEFMAYGSSMVVVWKLWREDKFFGVAFGKMLGLEQGSNISGNDCNT